MTSSLRYLIGGNPGGATHFVARYLTACGFPTTHESFYWSGGQIERICNLVTDAETPLAECSYTVGEWCWSPGVDMIPIISIVRDPFSVLNSIIAKKVLDGDTINPHGLMTEILARWRILKNSGRVVFWCHVERDLERLCSFLGVVPVSYAQIERHSHSKGHEYIPRHQLKAYPAYPDFAEFALLNGYRIP